LGLPPPTPPKPPKQPPKRETYAEALARIVNDVSRASRSEATELNRHIDAKRPPADLIKALQQEKTFLENKPATVWGIQTPRQFAVQYAGLDYKLPLAFLSTTLASVLGILIVGWLGALYITRHRELVIILAIDDYKLTFPHLLNFLPVHFEQLVSKLERRYKPRERKFNATLGRGFLSLLRTAVVLLLSVPLIYAFVISVAELWQLEDFPISTFFIGAAALVIMMVLQSIGLVLQEWILLSDKYFYEP
jgi:hypothetical protein